MSNNKYVQQGNHGLTSQRDDQHENNTNLMFEVNELFIHLKALTAVGRAFKSEYEENIVKQEWGIAFYECGINTRALIDIGLEEVRRMVRGSNGQIWFPTIGEFIGYCLGRVDTRGLAENAFDRFINGRTQTESVGQRVVNRYGFSLKILRADHCHSRFIELYLRCAQRFEPGIAVPQVEKEIKLSAAQQADKNRRAQIAQKETLTKFKSLLKIVDEVPKAPAGDHPSRDEQLKSVQHLLNTSTLGKRLSKNKTGGK